MTQFDLDMSDVLDPTGTWNAGEGTQLAGRLPTLESTRVALIDNGKPNANLLLLAVSERLQDRGVADAQFFTKEHVGVPIDATTLDEIRETCDFAIAAVGDCGSCSAGTAQDSLVLEQNGIPAVSICTEPFKVTAKATARSYGSDDFEFIFTRHPVASLTKDEIQERAITIAESVEALIRQEGSETA